MAEEPYHNAALSSNVRSAAEQAECLLALCTDVYVWHTPDGESFASLPVRGHVENWPISSRRVRLFLTERFYKKYKTPPREEATKRALEVLEAHALFGSDEHCIDMRLAGAEGENAVYLDLSDNKWEIVEIDERGWRIVPAKCAPVRFRRGSGMEAVPAPRPGGSLADLRPFLNVGTEDDFILLVGWLIGALCPRGPYPILCLNGEQGSAKSTTARVLQCLVDPKRAAIRSPPSNGRDLMIGAQNTWIQAFDNVSSINAWFSDALCSLATGGGFSARTLYSDKDETILEAQRPVILNGIPELATRSDLLDRAILVTLPGISSACRKNERDFWREFELVRPRLLGGLLDAIAAAIRNQGRVTRHELPRMADFATWVAAAEEVVPWEPGAFLTAYRRNRAVANAQALEDSPVAPAFLRWASSSDLPWKGTADELLRGLGCYSSDCPKTPRGLSGTLRRLAPNLRAEGFTITFGEREGGTGRRLIRIERRG